MLGTRGALSTRRRDAGLGDDPPRTVRVSLGQELELRRARGGCPMASLSHSRSATGSRASGPFTTVQEGKTSKAFLRQFESVQSRGTSTGRNVRSMVPPHDQLPTRRRGHRAAVPRRPTAAAAHRPRRAVRGRGGRAGRRPPPRFRPRTTHDRGHVPYGRGSRGAGQYRLRRRAPHIRRRTPPIPKPRTRAAIDVRRSPGDRVAIAMRNLPEFVVSFWGAALAGAIVVPLNSWWTGSELTYALRNAARRSCSPTRSGSNGS